MKLLQEIQTIIRVYESKKRERERVLAFHDETKETRSISTQKRRSLASTTEEQLADFRSEKKTLELAITQSFCMRYEDKMR